MEGHSTTLLVIEDEQPLLEAIRLKLGHSGFEVVTARSVEQAFGYLQDGVKIDAVWLDHYLLGKETGLDFVAKIKEDAQLRSLPIFIVSNSGAPDKKQSYLRLGAVKYYVKSDHRLDGIIGDIQAHLKQPEAE